jgi:hypothetical protein
MEKELTNELDQEIESLARSAVMKEMKDLLQSEVGRMAPVSGKLLAMTIKETPDWKSGMVALALALRAVVELGIDLNVGSRETVTTGVLRIFEHLLEADCGVFSMSKEEYQQFTEGKRH